MATTSGNSGVIRIGANAIAEVQEFSINRQIDTVEDSAMGDTDKSYLTILKGATVTGRCWNDDSDTNGQVAMTLGSTISLELYPAGTATGAEKITCSAIVTRYDKRVNRTAVNEFNFECLVTGAVTEATV